MRERDNLLIAFPTSRRRSATSRPHPCCSIRRKRRVSRKGWVISDRAALEWSDDNKRVFFGAKEQVAGARHAARARAPTSRRTSTCGTPRTSGSSRVQMIRAEQDRNFTFREAFDVAGGKFVKLADQTMRDVEVAPDGRWAVGRDTRGFIHDYKRPAADIYRVNTTTGERTLMLKSQLINTSTGSHTFGISPDGQYFLYWKDNKFQAYDLDAGEHAYARRRHRGQLRRHGVRPPGPEARLWHRRLHHRQEVGHRPAPLRSVAVAARRLGRAQSDQRRRREERDPFPLRADRARRPGAAGAPAVRAAAADAAAARTPARRSISPSRSRCRPTASTPRRPASTSSPTAS